MNTEIDLNDVIAGLDAMQKRGLDLRPVFRELRPIVRSDLVAHFVDGQSPSGKWAPRAQSTIDRLDARARNILTNMKGGARQKSGKLRAKTVRALSKMSPLGLLKSAWQFQIDAGSLVAQSYVGWSNIHQVGGRTPNGGVIPARPFAWLSDRVIDAFRDLAVAFIEEPW